jgi:RNA recognition motif-containing protein
VKLRKRKRRRKTNLGYAKFAWERLRTPENAKGKVVLICTRNTHFNVSCSFAFVDFTTTDFATAALINPRNHHLNGRDLVIEYAGADAVRRGAPKGQRQKAHGDASTTAERVEKMPRARKDPPPHKARAVYDEADTMRVDETANVSIPQPVRKSIREYENHQRGKGDRDKGRPRGRPRPGAALALAKRESAAIVPSQGQKIIF